MGVVGRRLPRTSRALLLTGSQGPAFLPCCPMGRCGEEDEEWAPPRHPPPGAGAGQLRQEEAVPGVARHTHTDRATSGRSPNDEASDEDDDDDEEGNIQGDEGWDVDYIVNRPTSAPDVDDDDDDCKRNYEEEGEGDKDCVKAGEDLTPYKKY